ncbi:MAG: hypothetical protein H0V44_10130 [Planctomycetes bacterium]|nr:hypothetical protein [Planctomycetota bacterium]
MREHILALTRPGTEATADSDRLRCPAFLISQHNDDAEVTLGANACDHAVLGRSSSWTWVSEVRGRIVLDASRVPRMTATLGMWIARVARGAPRRVAIHGTCEGLREAVLALRVDAVVNPSR